MIKNYLRIALRNLIRQKGLALINIFGLAIGLAFCMLIYLFVKDELTYDRFHDQAEQIFRVRSILFQPDGGVRRDNSNQPILLGPALEAELPEVEHAVRMRSLRHYVRASGEAVQENVLYADPAIFQVFTLPLLQGDPETALASLNGVVLTESMVRKYYNGQDPIGQTLWVRLMESYEAFTVTGVTPDLPGNSTIQFQMLLPFRKLTTAVEPFRSRTEHWGFVAIQTYIELAEETMVGEMREKLTAFFDRHSVNLVAEIRSGEGWPQDAPVGTYRFEPLTTIHLTHVSSPTYSYILSGIAVAILLIACINFMTLSIGRSDSRAKEIGVRKVVGARRTQLMTQFWGETIVLTFLSLIVSLLFVELFLPTFNELSSRALQLNYRGEWSTLAAVAGLVLFTGLAAGSYPALVLSNSKPIKTLKNRHGRKGSNVLTRSLVVLQFSLAVFLIADTLIMEEQLAYTRSRDLGFNQEQVVVIPTHGMDGVKVARQLRNALADETAIEGITATSNTLGNQGHDGYRFEYGGRTYDVSAFSVETNYLDFMGMQLAQGRNFDPLLATEAEASIIVNEALVREFDIAEPLGSEIPGFSSEPGKGPTIIGVVKDYNYQSLYQEIAPMMLTMDPEWPRGYVLARLHPHGIQRGLQLLRQAWQELVPEAPFEFSFQDENMRAQYREDRNWQRIVTYASIFAIVIASLGLFGLVTLSVSGRIKEIGIRKVLGGSVAKVTALLSKDFLKLVLLANLVAWPVGWMAMTRWLENFAYRIELGLWVFALAGAVVLVIALLTVSTQAVRAAWANPVETLRYE